MSHTAHPPSRRLSSRIFTMTVSAVEVDALTEREIERVIAEALAERLSLTVTVKADELPF